MNTAIMEDSYHCPLCNSILSIHENKLGGHCEGLVCEHCGVNARNRFFYCVLKQLIKEMRLGKDNVPPLDVLEASSYGYASMGQAYLDLMSNYVHLC